MKERHKTPARPLNEQEKLLRDAEKRIPQNQKLVAKREAEQAALRRAMAEKKRNLG